MHVDDVIIAEPILAPYALEQPLAAERHPRLAGENVEQVELDPGQLDRLAASARLARGRVDLEITEPPHAPVGSSARSRPAQHRLDPRHQLPR